MSSPWRILETIPARPGWRCVYAGPDGALRLVPVACWAVVDGIPGSSGPEVCPMVGEGRSGGLPRLEPLVQGAPGGCPPDYLGLAGPDEPLHPWEQRARAWSADRAPGLASSRAAEAPQEAP